MMVPIARTPCWHPGHESLHAPPWHFRSPRCVCCRRHNSQANRTPYKWKMQAGVHQQLAAATASVGRRGGDGLSACRNLRGHKQWNSSQKFVILSLICEFVDYTQTNAQHVLIFDLSRDGLPFQFMKYPLFPVRLIKEIFLPFQIGVGVLFITRTRLLEFCEFLKCSTLLLIFPIPSPQWRISRNGKTAPTISTATTTSFFLIYCLRHIHAA